MATSESDFNSQIRKDLKFYYPNANIWNNSDKFRSGLPDTSVLQGGHFHALEGKFVRELPKRETSKCLTHEVTASQIEFINKTRVAGGYGVIVVGMADIAVWMKEIKPNYTLAELLAAPRINRIGRSWDLSTFLQAIRFQVGYI